MLRFMNGVGGWSVCFRWAPVHALDACIFCTFVDVVVDAEIHSICGLLELVVVAQYAPCVDYHARGQK